MKRKLAIVGAVLSGLYLLTAGPIPDPIPFIDEGLALAVFIKCMGALGFNLQNWTNLFGKNAKPADTKRKDDPKDVTIDV
ncbi:MAG: hypothetical protein NWT08_01370 [Akkermansiaceae bacterium]|jgi:hypothetical protein|nr:hypothetical protein [Akkermansiaceae bacterium]MDP4645640.1 hypothetical protein [Akkermansiaceae bacterium]MDP4719887.1 hypothetical protein [Akkermansiaceae bacterium]MDP4778748.1 hypothetical protein [Akkermansiaceae bacterium]MDP4847050.1 hypothetical protein [Akkermansiaceae bacterium]